MIFDLFKSLFTKKNVKNANSPSAEAKNNIGIDVSDKVAEFRKYMTKNYNDLCKYPEFNLIKEEDKISLLNSIWDKWSLVGEKPIKLIAEKFPQYEYDTLKIIYAIESARVTDYCHMQKALELQKSGWADFVECYIGNSSFEDSSWGEIRKDWVRLVRIEDMIKCTDVYRRSKGNYCLYYFRYIMGTLKETRYLKNVYLYSSDEYIKMTPKEFKEYCKEKDYIYPLWLSSKEAKESGIKTPMTLKALLEKKQNKK